MRSVWKLLLYVGLVAACYWCGSRAYGDYAALMSEEGHDLARRARAKPGKGTNAPPVVGTNAPEVSATKTSPGTTATKVGAKGANAVVVGPGEEGEEPVAVRVGRRVGRSYFHLLGFTVGFAVAVVGLGFVVAQDFGHLLKFRLGKEVSYVDARSERNAQAERAEQLALKGDHVGAIQVLQLIVKQHPQHLHSALRIAELYDKELHDFPRAARHYEAALTLKFPPEQWGWIAIRLANIYSGPLKQPGAALALIRRLAAEQPGTPAGAKALQRLARITSAGLDPEAGGEGL
ncbi:MAG: hypothetical protein RL514_4363 [Verrucomicrobiota bacterium]|jgi:hypothetical protein